MDRVATGPATTATCHHLLPHYSRVERRLVAVVCLYSAALTVSVSFQNALTRKRACHPSVPFGECSVGEYEARFEVRSDRDSSGARQLLQYVVSFAIALLAGAWSDSHGRRRKPLIFLPIVGQILTDGLYFVNHFWYWPSTLDAIFTALIPGLYVGRNLFWIGVISYVSENSTIESRTLKLGTLIGSYTFSSLIGSGIVALLKIGTRYFHYYTLFMVPICFNSIAVLVVHSIITDTSDSYNKNIVWLRPKYLFKGFAALFKNKLKSFTVALVVLILCQSVLVARTGGEYAYVLRYIKHSLRWYDDKYVYFNVFKMISLFLGTLFPGVVFSYMTKVNDLVIGIFTCGFYIIAAVCYVVIVNQFWQFFMIMIINFCHGTAITVVTSLTSKMVEIEELGRLNSIQTSMNSLLTFGIVLAYKFTRDDIYYNKSVHLCLMTFLYVILTLPILYVFIVLYSKCKDFWEKDISSPKSTSIFVISRSTIC